MSILARAGMAAIVVPAALGGFAGTPRAAADNPVCVQETNGTGSVCAFYSPSHNISCEVDYQRVGGTGAGIPDETYCQTLVPEQSVTLDPTGALKKCAGTSCLGNAGEGTATLAYGQTAALGPFTCLSTTREVSCTVASGRGFRISRSGIASL
jgi:hypothetical protein